MKHANVKVEFVVRVSIDETKFTPEFMQEFRDSFYPFEIIEEHLEHLAQLFVRGHFDNCPGEFIEGYGDRENMSIYAEVINQYEEVLDE